jgi:hypothetical protein
MLKPRGVGKRSLEMKLSSIACASLALGLACLSGCNSGDKSSKPIGGNESLPQIDVVTSNKQVAVGDTTSLTVNSRNTFATNSQIRWDASGGKVTTEDNGRIARVKFDRPGTYTVTARLVINGQVVDSDSTTIEARPLR